MKIRLGEFCIFVNDKKYTWSSEKVVAYSTADAEFLKMLLSEACFAVDVITRVNNGETHVNTNNTPPQ